MRTSLLVRDLVGLLLATVAAALVYRGSRRHPARVAAVAARAGAWAAAHPTLLIVAAALLPLVLRLGVLFWVPPPVPRIADEFGHLLTADTLAHGRLANPPHPLARHLETIYVLQRPAYAPIYPIGQGLILAVGIVVTGTAWAGVLLAAMLMCGAITWMLLGHVSAGWAAIAGALAAVVLAPTHGGWIDSLWGGAFGAAAGAVLFGALLRLRTGPSPLLGLTAGAGWGILWLVRPYESLVPLVFTWTVLLAHALRGRRWRSWVVTLGLLALAQLGAGGLTALHNRAVTGSWMTLPYVHSQRLYGVPVSPLWQSTIEVTEFATREQAAVYEWHRTLKASAESRPFRYAGMIVDDAWRFFLGAWLCVPALVALVLLRDPVVAASRIVLAGALLTSALIPFFWPHYWAAYGGLFLLLVIRGLMRLQDWQPVGRPLGPALAAFFVVGALATVLHAVPLGPLLGVSDYGYVAPLRRQVADRLTAVDGQHVVFVKYGPTHSFHVEWVYNGAAIDESRIVWCRAIGPEEDAAVFRYYAGRRFWLAEVEAETVRLRRLPGPGGSSAVAGLAPEAEEWVFSFRPRGND